MRGNPRSRRLNNDHNALRQLQADSSIVQFHPYGDPPEAYDIYFDGAGVMRQGDHIAPQRQHHVEVRLGMNYPCVMPELRWRTPIFHPNISAGGAVCLGGYQMHWVPSLDMAELCEMLWDMIRYANYDVTSPYNRDAAIWARNQTTLQFPVDHRPLRDRVARSERSVNRRVASDEGIIIADSAEPVAGQSNRLQGDDDVLFIG